MASGCQACGAAVPDGGRFCPACGAPLAGASTADRPEQDERRVVSVLFADLAGSTALGERLEPEDVRALQDELFALANDEVERFGGVVEKYVGDAILAVFGIPQAHEDDAERAVRAALAIRTSFAPFAARVLDRHGAEVGLRIGIGTGEVIAGRNAAARGERMVTGDVVNVAARLEQLARAGEVLVGERTHAATRRVIAYRERGELEAKGKSRPIRAWNAVEATRPLGSSREARAPFVGRGDELETLRLAARRVARDRRPQLVTVFGQAGVGKSRLVAELAAGLDEAQVLVGRCVPYGDGLTYLPLAEIAAALAGVRDDDRTAEALSKLDAYVARVAPPERRAAVSEALAQTMGFGLPERRADLGLGSDLGRGLREGWRTLLTLLGQGQLVVLVVEDVHWASEALLDLLDSLVDTLEDSAVLIVCPSRPELLETRPSWGTGRLDVSSLVLSPLHEPEALELLQGLLGPAISDEVGRRILARAEGNPFYLEELLAMLVEQGVIEEREGRWVETNAGPSGAVPDSVHGVIAARLDLLESEERDALRRCSVMGRAFWPSAVGVDEELVAGLGRRGLVSEQADSAFSGRREFVFKHALTHEVAYTTLPRYERGALHRRVAAWLAETAPERRAEAVELVAFHYDEAIRYGEDDADVRLRAYDAALAAGEAAFRRGAFPTASRLLGRAEELATTSPERARVLLIAAHADIQLSHHDRAFARLDEVERVAAETEDPLLRADALGLKTRAAWLSGRWDDALAAAEAGVATLDGMPPTPELARGLARLSQILMLRSSPDAEAAAIRAISVARKTGERAAEANARDNLFTTLAVGGRLPPTEELEDVVRLSLAADAHDEAARAVVNYLWSAGALAPVEQVERVVREHLGGLERGLASEAFAEYLDLSLGLLVYVPAGRWREADAAVAVAESAVATARLLRLSLATGLALRRGRYELVDGDLPELRDTAIATGEPQRIVPMMAVAMPRAAIAGDLGELRALAEVVLALRPTPLWFSPIAVPIARSLAVAGEQELLAHLLSAIELLPEPATVVADLSRGYLAGLEGRRAESVAFIEPVEGRLRALDRRYEAACVALDLSQALRSAGRSDEADEAGTRAASVLEPLGCVNAY